MSFDPAPCLRLLSVSWPRPVESCDDRWTSAPDWDAPLMPCLPAWRFQTFGSDGYFTIDWRDVFRTDLNTAGQPTPGDMRGFHIVFRLRAEQGGRLRFVDSDGSIIRRNGEVIHEDREAHPLRCHELSVNPGDRLEVAQWQSRGDWIWGARRETVPMPFDGAMEVAGPYQRAIEKALADPNGPPLKVFTSATHPLRCALSLYSMVLNGYRPAGIQIFGDYQWGAGQRRAMEALLPFADIVSRDRVDRVLDTLDPRLVPLSRRVWSAMKICIGLFVPPLEYCFLDDDIFVLDRIDDALRLHETHTLVYARDLDYEEQYRPIWCPERTVPILGDINTGFYLMRNRSAPEAQIGRLLRVPPDEHLAWAWEQAFFAVEFAGDTVAALPTQRYFYSSLDGLPGGLLGYDWHANPCDFATVHFGGPKPKPTDHAAGALAHDILRRHRAAR